MHGMPDIPGAQAGLLSALAGLLLMFGVGS